jgi:hypothetical protein
VLETGVYHLIINGDSDTKSYLYQDTFHPSGALTNQLLLSYEQCSTIDYKIGIYLQSNTTYELIITTLYLIMSETFSILVIGPNNVNFNHISKFFEIISMIITTIILSERSISQPNDIQNIIH